MLVFQIPGLFQSDDDGCLRTQLRGVNVDRLRLGLSYLRYNFTKQKSLVEAEAVFATGCVYTQSRNMQRYYPDRSWAPYLPKVTDHPSSSSSNINHILRLVIFAAFNT